MQYDKVEFLRHFSISVFLPELKHHYIRCAQLGVRAKCGRFSVNFCLETVGKHVVTRQSMWKNMKARERRRSRQSMSKSCQRTSKHVKYTIKARWTTRQSKENMSKQGKYSKIRQSMSNTSKHVITHKFTENLADFARRRKLPWPRLS